MELLINHISQLRLDRRDADNYDILSQISGIMDSAFAMLRFGCLLRRNVGYITIAGLETINYQNMIKQIRSTKLGIRTIPALVIYRVRCLYFLIFLGGIFYV